MSQCPGFAIISSRTSVPPWEYKCKTAASNSLKPWRLNLRLCLKSALEVRLRPQMGALKYEEVIIILLQNFSEWAFYSRCSTKTEFVLRSESSPFQVQIQWNGLKASIYWFDNQFCFPVWHKMTEKFPQIHFRKKIDDVAFISKSAQH